MQCTTRNLVYDYIIPPDCVPRYIGHFAAHFILLSVLDFSSSFRRDSYEPLLTSSLCYFILLNSFTVHLVQVSCPNLAVSTPSYADTSTNPNTNTSRLRLLPDSFAKLQLAEAAFTSCSWMQSGRRRSYPTGIQSRIQHAAHNTSEIRSTGNFEFCWNTTALRPAGL
jgi:hypothetical protein